LRKDVTTLLSELTITRAYVRLFFASPNEDGSKTVSLARIGKYEVLLVEFAQPWLADSPPLWLELYAHDIDAAIDSCCCQDFEEMVYAAKQLILHAKEMNDESQAASDRKQP
jgi:hypothetical protein